MATQSPAIFYGMGLAKLGTEFYGHTGELPGYNSYMGYDPVNKMTVVVWSNLAPGAKGTAPATTIARELIDELYGTTHPTFGMRFSRILLIAQFGNGQMRDGSTWCIRLTVCRDHCR